MVYTLGIDLGTTSVKVSVIDSTDLSMVHSQSKATLSDVMVGDVRGESLQDVARMYQALEQCINNISQDILSQVVSIGVSGQMHGVVYWKDGSGWQTNLKERLEVGSGVSYLHTWQDSRCDPYFLETLPKPSSNIKVNSGYGCATTFWYLRNNPEYLKQFDRMGSVMDFLVCMLTNMEQPVISDQNAMSFGFFDPETGTWDVDCLTKAGFPVHILPKVVVAGSVAGELASCWLGVPSGVTLTAALGDFQCSVRSLIDDPNKDGILNVSTSAQLAFVMSGDPYQKVEQLPASIDFFPYFQGKYLAVAASLNGGNVLAAFVNMIRDVTSQFGVDLHHEDIWRKMVEVGHDEPDDSVGQLQISPLIFGERHDPDIRGSITNIGRDNLTFENVVRGIYTGLVSNLSQMMSSQLLKRHGISRVMASGSVVNKHKGLRDEIKKFYDQEISFREEGDSSYGAALVAANNI